MIYCYHCGKPIPDNKAKFCAVCGSPVMQAAGINPQAAEKPDKAEPYLCVLSLFVTILGFILYAVELKTHPHAANTYLKFGIGALVSRIALYILCFLIWACIALIVGGFHFIST